MTYRMYAPVKLSNISIHSACVVGYSSKRVLILHVLSLAVCTAFWSGYVHVYHVSYNISDFRYLEAK